MTTTLKISMVQFNGILGNIQYNIEQILKNYNNANKQGVDLVVTCEMSTTFYPLEDLVLNKEFLFRVKEAILKIPEQLKEETGLLIGAPWVINNKVYNTAILLQKNKEMQIVKKVCLPNYGVFDDKRTFTAGELNDVKPVEFKSYKLGVLICEDTWFPNVTQHLTSKGAQILISMNASPFECSKQKIRYETVANRVKETNLTCIYCAQLGGQDELVFDGSSFVMSLMKNKYDINHEPYVSLQMKHFEEDIAIINLKQKCGTFYHDDNNFSIETSWKDLPNENINETAYNALILGLRDYYTKSKIFKGIVLGLSGGVDSAIVATIAADAIGAENVLCVRLPSKYSSDHSLTDAEELSNRINCKCKTINIQNAVNAIEFNDDLQNLFKEEGKIIADTTEENIQARVRDIDILAISNKLGYLPLSTGNKSEISIGYLSHFDGSLGFNPIGDLYKTFIFQLCKWRNENIPTLSLCKKLNIIPQNIITKPPSAELKPGQMDQDSLPPYEILDDILKKSIEEEWTNEEFIKNNYDINLVKKIHNLLYSAEWKRRMFCPCIKITSRNFGKSRRYPIINQCL